MDETRVIEKRERTLTVEHDDGDRFSLASPTSHVQDIRLAGPPVWKSGSEPDIAAIWIDDARPVATAAARERGWLPPVA